MRREKTAFSVDETVRAKTLRRELFKPKHWREPQCDGAQGQGTDKMRV